MRTIFLFFFLVSLAFSLQAQNRHKLDSLKKIAATQQDTIRIKTLTALCIEYLKIDRDTAIMIAAQFSKESEKINWIKGIGNASHLTAQAYHMKSEFHKALAQWEKTIEIRRKAKDKKGESRVYNNIGILCLLDGDYQKALEYYFKGLKMKEELGIKDLSAEYANMGKVYVQLEKYDKAIESYLRSIKIDEELGNPQSAAITKGWVGGAYIHMKQYDKGKEYCELSIEQLEKYENHNDLGEVLGNMGLIYSNTGDDNKALEYHLRSLKINQKIKNKTGEIRDLGNAASIYLKLKNYKESERMILKAYSLADTLGILGYKQSLQGTLSNLYFAMGEYKKAYQHAYLYAQLKDSLFHTDKSLEIGKLEAKAEFTKQKAIEEAELKKEKEKQEAIAHGEKRRNNLIIGIIALIALSIGIIALIVFRSLRITKSQKSIIENQKHLVEEKQKEIVDSINYAKRIQEAILPAKELKYRIFPDAFVLFQPKDIVSGDFYWFAEKNNKRLIAAVDCTGHGVPGAFMSMIGNTFLNEIVNVKGITEPALILDHLREQIITSLKQSGGENKDGMDISILAVSPSGGGKGEENIKVEWAGANNPLWIIRNNECLEYKANKQPVGYYVGNPVPFTNNIIETKKGDVFYIFTDGFADQFGGEKGKKFKYKNLKDILLSMHSKPMPQQEKFLLNAFNDWKHSLEQIDDVCIIGLRV